MKGALYLPDSVAEFRSCTSNEALHEKAMKKQLLQLSPLDAFKAKGRHLHDQLRKGQLQTNMTVKENYRPSSSETVDAFSFDQTLQSRRSKIVGSTGPAPLSVLSDRDLAEGIRASQDCHGEKQSPGNEPITQYHTNNTARDRHWSCAGSLITPIEEDLLADLSLHSSSPRSPPSRTHTPKVWTASSTPPSAFSSRRMSAESVQSRYSSMKDSPGESVYPASALLRRPSGIKASSAEDAGLVAHSSDLSEHATVLGPFLAHLNGAHPEADTSSPNRSQKSKVLNRGPSRGIASPSSQINHASAKSPASSGTPASRLRSSRPNSISKKDVASFPDAALNAITHVELGIEQHENNQLPQSTHHFKVAAEMGDLTGCLLYGLALRHGWGIRPDLKRSVQMLQRAADSVDLSTDNLGSARMFTTPLNDQLSVAIYELAISFKNGWGVDTNKKTSLKYLELASELGDVEAMVETANCYMQGVGCKKDKSKAAKLLRMAEAKGKKEIGNSWIWKSKYDE